MKKLYIEGYHPGIIIHIASYLTPPSCLLQKNTDGTRFFSVSKGINDVIKDIKKNLPCSIVTVCDIDKCKYHCKASPIYAMLQDRIDADKGGEFIHFSTLKRANFLLHHKPELIDRKCCGGMGFRWKHNHKGVNIFGFKDKGYNIKCCFCC